MVDISILVCTRNRADKLRNTLDSVAKAVCRVPGNIVELVLVDNGSTDNTKEVVRSWQREVSFPVHYVFEGQAGLSIARNTGIKASSGRLMAFTDDDCVLNPDYLVVLDRYFANDAGLVMRGGKVALGDSTDQPFTLRLGDAPERLTDMDKPGGFIIGANMAARRELIDKIGLFDERFGAGAVFQSGEETDYFYRAFRAGYPVEYVPDLIVWHFHGRKDARAIVRMNSGYQVGTGAIYAKHIRDKKLLRHFYWDIKRYVHLYLFDRKQLQHPLGLSYGAGLLETAKGMLLYGVENARRYLRIFQYRL